MWQIPIRGGNPVSWVLPLAVERRCKHRPDAAIPYRNRDGSKHNMLECIRHNMLVTARQNRLVLV